MDLVSLPGTLFQSIVQLGGPALYIRMSELLADPVLLGLPGSEFFSAHQGEIRRLVGIPDLEGKTRVIAILDYWSQAALRPVHNFLFEVLKIIPQDVTFDQGSFAAHVKR